MTSDQLDFAIYHSAGGKALMGQSPYRFYGPYELPYQYLPWVAWMFLPLSMLPINLSWTIFVFLNLLLLASACFILAIVHKSSLQWHEIIFLAATSLIMNALALRVGQVSVIHLAVIIAAIVCIQSDRGILAGSIFPLIVMKPHLTMLIAPALLWKGGRKMRASSVISIAVLTVIATLLQPSWIGEMQDVIVKGQLRNDPLAWNFTTFATLIGLPRKWNYVFALILVPLGAWVAYQIRYLPTSAWLSVVLSISLLTAPYAFAYDLPLLLPALFWLTDSWTVRTRWLWLSSALLCVAAGYSSGTYIVTLIVTAAAVGRAWTWRQLARPVVATIYPPMPSSGLSTDLHRPKV